MLNITILTGTGDSTLKLVGDVLILTVGEDLIVPSNTPNEFMETYASAIISEVKRIKETSLEHARNFIDFSTFDEIVTCLRAGKSDACDLNPALLAQVFCHISMSKTQQLGV